MKVLLTGAFGNLGSIVLEKLLQAGHDVTCFDVNNKVNSEVAANIPGNYVTHWGDIRDSNTVIKLVEDQDAIIHLAAIIAPFSENNPELSYEVNVKGTETLLRAAEQSDKKPVFVFSSSCSVYGFTQDKEPPRTIDEPLCKTDGYSGHKIECEKMIQESSANWVITRIGGMVDSRMRHSDKQQMKLAFSISANNRIEFIHPKDAATAFINAISEPKALSKVLLLGGGSACQVTHYDLVNVMTSAMGITLPTSHFGKEQLYSDWADTDEAQAILDFQHHSFADFEQECQDKFKWIRWIAKPFSPLVVRLMPLYIKYS